MKNELPVLKEAINPFESFVDPTASTQAHMRMRSQALQTVIHRPLDKLPATAHHCGDDVLAEPQGEVDYSDILTSGFGVRH